MKKILITILSLILGLTTIGVMGCKGNDEKNIKIGASSTPHAMILEQVKETLKEQGYNLEIIIYDDYKIPNVLLSEGELDANYFQHAPFMEDFNSSNRGTKLVSAGTVHYEPFGVFGNGVSTLENLPKGTKIFIPSDASNGTRAMFLLKEQGVIELKAGVGADDILSTLDITDNKGYEIVAVPAEEIPTQMSANSGSLGVLNGNYAILNNIKIEDAICVEDDTGEFPKKYANIIAVRQGDETSPKIVALIKALQTQKIKDYIDQEFKIAVRPIFDNEK